MYSAMAFIGIGLVMDSVRKDQLVFRERRLAALLDARKQRGSDFERPTMHS